MFTKKYYRMRNLFSKIKLVLSLFFVLTRLVVFAQHSPTLGHFDLSKNNEKVFLNWSITQGNLCNGIEILRSIDKINFERIGGIQGICGSTSSTIEYLFIDEKPVKNKINYYKLELGSLLDFQVLSIEITDIEENGYQVRPNPAVDYTKIYFNNDKRKEHQFSLYNLNGTLVFFTKTEEDIIEINTQSLLPGLYIFDIIGGNNPIKIVGKIIVQ